MFSRAWRRLHVFALRFDWFIALFACCEHLFLHYQVESPALPNEWVYVMVTWKKKDGMQMYYNAQLRVQDTTGKPVSLTTVSPYKNNFVIGREVGNNGPFHAGKFEMASFTTFAGRLPQDDVNAAYIFFWSGCKYYGLLCIPFFRLHRNQFRLSES